LAEAHGVLAEQFDDLEQQREAVQLGMWAFLTTEVMFFGGLFTGYAVYRWSHPAAFAEASRHLDVLLGTVNTAVLICSSLTMALAVHAASLGRKRPTAGWLALTIALGSVFLGIKAIEYSHKFHEHLVPGRHFHMEGTQGASGQLFFSFYFAMTGVHALHMVIGIAILAVLIVKALRGRYGPENHSAVEMTGLYWHFVDIVWIFLFPLLYLIGRH
jgi:cytochrome c oxidase subunit 3